MMIRWYVDNRRSDAGARDQCPVRVRRQGERPGHRKAGAHWGIADGVVSFSAAPTWAICTLPSGSATVPRSSNGSGSSARALAVEGLDGPDEADDGEPVHQASRALFPMVVPCSRPRGVSIIGVNGWYSARTRTAVGMVSVGTIPEPTSGSKISGKGALLALGKLIQIAAIVSATEELARSVAACTTDER